MPSSQDTCEARTCSTLCVFFFQSDGIFLSDAGKGSLLRPWVSSISGQEPNSDCLQNSYYASDTVVQTVKNPPAMWEPWVPSLGWGDLLEEGMAAHSSIPAWRIPMDRGAWQATVPGVTKNWPQLGDYAHVVFSVLLALSKSSHINCRISIVLVFLLTKAKALLSPVSYYLVLFLTNARKWCENCWVEDAKWKQIWLLPVRSVWWSGLSHFLPVGKHMGQKSVFSW